ncbi:SMP-30/gluconolactonase/LRE family protein [Limnohabitans sp.]|jgi:L-arabinonolactonase|uniref:SMP-30/gluconolactonase/LRE family protein n=1 Tax=Limnohabitans sp. TaxID=1907725 RepID=UPI0037C0960A
MTRPDHQENAQFLIPDEIHCFSHEKSALGECPLWDVRTESVWWLDCRRGVIHKKHTRTGSHVQLELPAPLGSVAFNMDGRLVVALKEEIALLDPETGQIQRLGRLDEQHPNLRFNDGAALPDGRFLVGTMHTFRLPGEKALGGLYMVETDGHMSCIDRGLGVVNGPVAHPFTGVIHVADSEARQIYRYTHTDEEHWGRQIFVDTQALESSPDGCCFDAKGGLWTALVRKGQLARFDDHGQLTHLVRVPLTHPTALCFGGDEMTDLFVTSISDSGRLRADGPWDGHVLRLRGLGFQGVERPICRIQPSLG